MINFRGILSTIYADRTADELYAWLGNHELLESFKRAVAQLNTLITEEEKLTKNCHSLPVGHIAANLLWAINKRIATEGNPENAKALENILGDICLQLLLTFLNSIKSNRTAIWLQINYALKDTCNFHNYDFNQLIRFLKIDAAASYLRSQKMADPVVMSSTIPFLLWKGSPKDKNDFLGIFSNQKLIKSKKRLAKLFDNPEEPLQLQLDPTQADLVLQFFYTIKKIKLVSYSGCKGFYEVLEFHLLDFKKDFLRNQKAGRRINALHQTVSKWNDNQRRIDSWLQSFHVNATGILPVLQT